MRTRTPLPADWAHLPDELGAHLAEVIESPHTIRAYVSRARQYLAWLADTDPATYCPGDTSDCDPIADARAATFAAREYRAWLQTTRKASPQTVNAHLTAIEAFYRWRGVDVGMPKRDRVPTRAPEALTTAQTKILVRAAETLPPRDQAIVALLRLAGLRVAELVALDAADVLVTARKGVIHVRRGKGARHRTIPMSPELHAAMGDYLAHRRELTAAGGHEAALLLARGGARLSVQQVRKILARVGTHAGISGLRPHMLRHTFGTQMVRGGVDLVTVADLMGHASIETTRGYTTSTEDDRMAALAALYTDR